MKPALSVVVPVYGCAECLEELSLRLISVLAGIPGESEILFVDDRAPDDAWEIIKRIANEEPFVRGIRLSRNFGQHFAITAGLDHAAGDHVVVMDCDLQDDPAYIPELYQKAREGYDIVYTRKRRRHHGFLKNLLAKAYNRIFNFLTDDVPSYADVGAFSVISRRVVDAFRRIQDRHRHYLLILRWLGYPSVFVEIDHKPRAAGKSSYSFGRLVALALDGITSQSTKLLQVTIGIGGLFVFGALIGIVALVALYFIHGFQEGWASTMVLILFSTGAILFSIGIAGIYIGNIFDQVRGRPLYLVEERCNLEERS